VLRHSVPLRRVSCVEEIRPKEALQSDAGTNAHEAASDRSALERKEQAFFNFNHEGFVTDVMPEANAAEKLERTIKEAQPVRKGI
jgi:hypothetical protein